MVFTLLYTRCLQVSFHQNFQVNPNGGTVPYKAFLGVGVSLTRFRYLELLVLDWHSGKLPGAASSPRGFARAPGPEAGAWRMPRMRMALDGHV